MKGSYILLLELPEGNNIAVGRLGVLEFPPGFYAYVGSALGGLEARVGRHLRKDKRLHWHIDYLLCRANISEAILLPGEQRLECSLAQALARRFSFIPRFGSSDCQCQSHLFFEEDEERLRTGIARMLAEKGLFAKFAPIQEADEGLLPNTRR